MKTFIATTTILLFAAFTSSQAALWSDASGDPNGWKSVDWFGEFWSSSEDAGWLYHVDLGWLYAQGDSQDSIVFYGEGLGDFFSGDGTYPNLYLYGLDRWVYYSNFGGLTSYPLQYWDVEHGLWVSRDSLAFEMQPANPLGNEYTRTKTFVFIRHGQRYPEANLTNGIQYSLSQLGELTEVGQLEEQNLGRIFKGKLTSLDLDADNCFITADTSSSRTIESAEYFSVGLGIYQNANDVELQQLNTDIFEGKSDECSEEVSNDIERSVAWRAQDKAFIETSQAAWQTAAGKSLSFGDAYDLADYLQFNAITNRPLPEGFTIEDINTAWQYANFQNRQTADSAYLSWKETEYIFEAIWEGIREDDIFGKSSMGKSFFLFGGHDGNLAPLMGALQSPLDANPIFASFLEISVYTKSSDSSEYIHAIYNGKALDLSKIPNGANPCPVDAFLDYLEHGPTSPCEED